MRPSLLRRISAICFTAATLAAIVAAPAHATGTTHDLHGDWSLKENISNAVYPGCLDIPTADMAQGTFNGQYGFNQSGGTLGDCRDGFSTYTSKNSMIGTADGSTVTIWTGLPPSSLNINYTVLRGTITGDSITGVRVTCPYGNGVIGNEGNFAMSRVPNAAPADPTGPAATNPDFLCDLPDPDFTGTGSTGTTGTTGSTTATTGTTDGTTGTNPTGKRRSATVVICNTGPTRTSPANCLAIVGDAEQTAGASAPTGTVQWTLWGPGSISPASCTLHFQAGATSSCSMTFRPSSDGIDAGTELPVFATYTGSDKHLGSSQPHRLIYANVVDPGTQIPQAEQTLPPTKSDCDSAADALPKSAAGASSLRSRTGPFATIAKVPSYFEAPKGSQPGVIEQGARFGGQCLCQVGAVLVLGGKSAVQGVGSVLWTGGWAAGGGWLGAAGGPVTATGGTVIAGGVAWTYGGEYMAKASADSFHDMSVAVVDPPESGYTKLAQPAKVKAIHFKPKHVADRADFALLSTFATAVAKAHAIGVAYTTTVNRAGGARVAGNTHWQGRQTLHARALALKLAAAEYALSPLAAKVAKRSKVAKAARRRTTLKQVRALRAYVRRHGHLGTVQARTLRHLGYSNAEIASVAKLLKGKTAPDKLFARGPSDTLNDSYYLSQFKSIARFMRLWAYNGAIINISQQP